MPNAERIFFIRHALRAGTGEAWFDIDSLQVAEEIVISMAGYGLPPRSVAWAALKLRTETRSCIE